MRTILRAILAVAVAVAAVAVLPEQSFARGGGGGGGGGGGRGGKGGGGKRGGKGKGGGAATVLGNRSPTDYIDAAQHEDATAERADFLVFQRYASLLRAAEDDREASLRAARDRASTARRDSGESASHPL